MRGRVMRSPGEAVDCVICIITKRQMEYLHRWVHNGSVGCDADERRATTVYCSRTLFHDDKRKDLDQPRIRFSHLQVVVVAMLEKPKIK